MQTLRCNRLLWVHRRYKDSTRHSARRCRLVQWSLSGIRSDIIIPWNNLINVHAADIELLKILVRTIFPDNKSIR